MNILILATLLSWILTGLWISWMQSMRLGKNIRADGPQSHLAKQGTPSMGGVAFLVAAAIAYFWLGNGEWKELWLLVLGSGLLGLFDDLGGSMKRPLKAREKLVVQFLMSLVFAFWASENVDYTSSKFLDILLFTVAIMGFNNAFNFTDGVDGLLGTVTAVMLIPFSGFAIASAAIGSLLGFLWYNAPKAKVFMGDTGSMALGSMVAGLMILDGKMWFLPLVALIPVLEILSVVIQTTYFRRTGKRVFRMSPIHHHFELSGWLESTIVFRFAIITAIATALSVWLWTKPT